MRSRSSCTVDGLPDTRPHLGTIMPKRCAMIAAGVLTCVAPGAAPGAPPAYRLDGSIKGPDMRWDYLSFDAKGRRLYIGQVGGVTGIDVVTGKVTQHLTRSAFIHGVIPIGDTGLAAAANGAASSVTIFDGATGSTAAEVRTGREPDALVYEPAGKQLLSLNEGSQDATVIDLAGKSAAGSIPLGGKPEFAAADGRGLIYDNIEDRNEIVAIDVAGRRVTRHIPLAGCDGPTGLAYDHATGLLISACSNGTVKVVDAASGRSIASIAVGKGPDAVILDEVRRAAFIPSGGTATLSVISLADPARPALVQALATRPGVRTGAVDPFTGKVYLASSDFLADRRPGERPAVAPGTFRVLVVSPE